MNEKMTAMLRASKFTIDPENYRFVTVSELPPTGTYRMLFQDSVETTVVCPEANIANLKTIEQNPNTYRLIRVMPSTPFYAVGFTGAITTAFGQAGANVVVLGTYSFDYMAIRAEQLELARTALINLGLTEEAFK